MSPVSNPTMGASTSNDEFEVYCATILARHDAEQATIAALVESTAAMAQRAAQRARATSELLNALRVELGTSEWPRQRTVNRFPLRVVR